MLHKIIGWGYGGAKGVMDYMLKEEDKKTPRAGATVLRGDIDMQSKIIDSLAGKFKETYVTGCFSFEESPDEISEEQKEEIMDGAEELILAGLSPDRVSITWIEHTDKKHDDVNNPRYGQNRLELNYIVACVDLEHGRAFQPYIQSQDVKRFNAFKDIQNIKHGYTDPNDPAKARNLAQPKKLPKKVAELKEVITEHIEGLVAEGLVNNRDDVKQALKDLGFELSRESTSSISVIRPDGGKNLKFTSAKNGGLYDINFKSSATSEAKIREASERHRASAAERLREAHRVYERELARKAEYHQKRHGQPRREQRAINANAQKAQQRYKYSTYGLFEQRPSPFNPRFKTIRKRHADDDTELHRAYRATDTAEREQHTADIRVRDEQISNNTRRGFTNNFPGRSDVRGNNSDKSRGLDNEQTATRQDRQGTDSTARHDTATTANAQRQRQLYSRVGELAKTVNNNANRATTTLTEVTRQLEEHNQRAEKATEYVVNSSQRTSETNEYLVERVNNTIRASNSADRAYETISEYDSTTKQSIERYRAVRERIGRASKFTEENYGQSTITKDTATELAKTASRIEIAQEKQQQQQQEVKASRSYSPRMR